MAEVSGVRITIKNWQKFQHYKNRNPPWIRLYRSLLNNRDWHRLSGDACKLLVECWLLASENDSGVIEAADLEELAWRLRRDSIALSSLFRELVSAGFVSTSGRFDSTMQAGRLQHATPETETETDTDTSSLRSEAAPDEGTAITHIGEVIPFDVTDADVPDEEIPRIDQRSIMGAWLEQYAERPNIGTVRKQGRVAARIAQLPAVDVLAALAGIRRLYPHSEGEPWDLFDLERKFAKAVVAGQQANEPMRRRAAGGEEWRESPPEWDPNIFQ